LISLATKVPSAVSSATAKSPSSSTTRVWPTYCSNKTRQPQRHDEKSPRYGIKDLRYILTNTNLRSLKSSDCIHLLSSIVGE
jgi:hypothetical protein